MTTLYTLTSTLTLSNARLDLSDVIPDSSGAFRWTDNDINRAINRALERISQALPLISAQQTPAIPGSSTYPVPPGAFYIDQVEYPVGNWPRSFRQFRERRSPLLAPPTQSDVTLMSVANSAAPGSVPAGTIQYGITYTSPGGGETTISPLSTGLVTPGNQGVTLNNIPLGFSGASGRNIYRVINGGSPALITTIADTLTTTYIDQAAAGTTAPPGANSTQGIETFELILPPELWPNDANKLLEITYMQLHQLDTTGTTLPERHWDALYLGTVAYAMFAYLPQVNDNFDYVDGHLRDRIDDTKAAVAWQTQCFHAMSDFENRIKKITEEANQGIHQSTQWGDVPLRWERL